jgi:hypothetical protein
MHEPTRFMAIVVLALLATTLLTGTASAGVLTSASSFICNGGDIGRASVSVSETRAGLVLRFRATGLPPHVPVQCGFYCTAVSTGGEGGPCGAADAAGRWSFTTVLPPQTCFGMIPAFLVTDIGTCVPGLTSP